MQLAMSSTNVIPAGATVCPVSGRWDRHHQQQQQQQTGGLLSFRYGGSSKSDARCATWMPCSPPRNTKSCRCSARSVSALGTSRRSTERKVFSRSKLSSGAVHHRLMFRTSYLRSATCDSVSCYSRLSGEIQKQRERRVKRQGSIARALQNGSNYERDGQRWLREEQRWLREEQRWQREEARWTNANQELQEEVRALKNELEELRGQRGYGGEITDTSLRNLVAGMRNLLQALALPGSEDLPLVDRPEVLKRIPGTLPLSGETATTYVLEKSESVVPPVGFVSSPDIIIAVETPKSGPGNFTEPRSPTQVSPNPSQLTNGVTSNARAPTTATTKRPMKIGMEGDDVKELHDALSELGFYSGEEDIEFSVFSDGTQRAVKTWQSTRGVAEDGKVTKELMAALLAEAAANISSKTHGTKSNSQSSTNANISSRTDGTKSNSQPSTKAETTLKTKKQTPETKQPGSGDDLREIDRYERSDSQETGTGSSRRVYLLGENRWEEPDRLQKKQDDERRRKNGHASSMKVGVETCFACRGVRTMVCTECEGTGDLNVEEQFLEWLDEGEAKCPYCEGSGAVECDVCIGVGLRVER